MAVNVTIEDMLAGHAALAKDSEFYLLAKSWCAPLFVSLHRILMVRNFNLTNHPSSLPTPFFPFQPFLYQNYILPAATAEPLGVSTKLRANTSASLGDKLPEVFLDGYVPQFIAVIAFLLWKERVVLPDYHSVEDTLLLPLCFRALLSSIIRFSTDRYGDDDVCEFLRFASTSVAKDEEFLIPKSVGQLDKTCSAVISCLMVSWKAARAGMRKAGKREFYGLTPKQCDVVYFLKNDEPIPMTSLHTMSALCAKHRGLGTPFPVNVFETKGGGIGTQVGEQYLDCSGVQRIVLFLYRQADDLALKLFSDLDPSLTLLIGGGIFVSCDDNDSCDEAKFSYNLVGDDGRTKTVTSDSLNSKLNFKLSSILVKEAFDTWLSDYVRYGKVLQAAHSLIGPRRETENEAIVRRNGAGGLKRKLRWYNHLRSDCETVALCIFIRCKEKWSSVIDECVSVVHPNLSIHLLLFSCLRGGVAAGLKDSRHWKHAIPPDFLTMLFIGHTLMRERKGLGAENTNSQILASVEALNKKRAELDAILEAFQAHAIRHFHNALLKYVQDQLSNVEGGRAATIRRDIAESGIQGHSRLTGDGYVDNAMTMNDSLYLNQSTMVDLIEVGKRMLGTLNMKYAHTSHWESNTKVKRIEFKSLGEAMEFGKDDDLDSREKKAKLFLLDNISLLATAIHAASSDGLEWDTDILRGLAHVLAVDERPVDSTTDEKSVNSTASEGNFRRILEAKLGCGRGKTLLIAIPALLQQHYIEKSNSKVTFVVVPNKNLMKDLKAELQEMGLNVVEGKDMRELQKMVWSKTGTGVVMSVLDTFLKVCMSGAVDLIRGGKLVRIVLDEAHEFSLQKSFRPVFNQAIVHLRNLRVNYTILSGTFSEPVQKDVLEMLGIDSAIDQVCSITSTVDVVEAAQVRFEKKAGNSKKAVLEAIVGLAVTSAASKSYHLIAVLTTAQGSDIVEMLKEKGVKALLAAALTRGLKGWDESISAWKDGTGDSYVLVSTQPLNGLNHKSLLVVDVCGSHCLISALQSALRVARSRGSKGTARFWTWDDMTLDCFGPEFDDRHPIHVCNMASYDQLVSGDHCLRKVLALSSAIGTSDTSDDAVRAMKGCPANLVEGGPLLCSVCHPDDLPPSFMVSRVFRRPVAVSPRRPIQQGVNRQHALISGGTIEAPDTVRAAVLAKASFLKTKGLCYYCGGSGCNNSPCAKLGLDVAYKCFWCLGKIDHVGGVMTCPLQPNNHCSKICSKCYDVNCTDLQLHTTSTGNEQLRQACVNFGVDVKLLSKNFAVITTTMFEDHYRGKFEEFLLLNFKSAHQSLMYLSKIDHQSNFEWLFEAMGGQVGADQQVYNLNLALLFRWNGAGGEDAFLLVGSAASPKKSNTGGGGRAAENADKSSASSSFDEDAGGGYFDDSDDNVRGQGLVESDLDANDMQVEDIVGGGPPNGRRSAVPTNPYLKKRQVLNPFAVTADRGSSSSGGMPSDKPPPRHYCASFNPGSSGEWVCPECDVLNFKTRVDCFQCRRKKPAWVKVSNGNMVHADDWVCSCLQFNFGRNTICFKSACSILRPVWSEENGCNVYKG